MIQPIRKQQTRFVEAVVDGDVVLMNIATGRFFTLAGSAAAIWALIDGERDRTAIATELCTVFDGNADAIERDLGDFLDQLSDAGLVA